jgi:hypothetical protein
MHQIDINLDSSPAGSSQRTQQAIDFVGELIFRLRDEVLESQRSLLNSKSHRKQLGTALAKPFEVLSDLSDDQINALVEVCQQGIDSFAQLLLSYLEHQGSQLRFADNKLAHFILIMQVLDFGSQKVIEEHCLNRSEGTKFALRWGRWFLNHAKKQSRRPAGDSE